MVESLFTNYIIRINYLKRNQLEKIDFIMQKNPKVFFSAELLKINKTVSFFSFFLKEFFDYTISKTPDGIYYFKLRKIIRKIESLKENNVFLKRKKKE